VSTTCFDHASSVLDYDALVGRCVGNVAFAQRLLGKFLDRFEADLTLLRQEWEQQNISEIAQVAHRVKGASASVSAVELSQQAAELERSSRDKRVTEIPACLEGLEEAWNRFLEVAESLRSDAGPPG
jgi:HPt (histidine-containing phosphotransfer) domain-containing protein